MTENPTGNGGQVPSAYERGKKDAGVDAELDAHNSRLDKIAAAIEKSAAGMLALEATVRKQGEDARLAAATLIAAAEALAKETETRRIVLADTKAIGEQKFSRREGPPTKEEHMPDGFRPIAKAVVGLLAPLITVHRLEALISRITQGRSARGL